MEEPELIKDEDIIMKGGAGAGPGAPGPGAPVVQNYIVPDQIDANLLQILDDGINRIVMKIKAKLGNDIPTTNASAKKIIDMLEGIVGIINPQLTHLATADPNSITITRDAADRNLYKSSAAPAGYVNLDAASPDINEPNLLRFKQNAIYLDDGALDYGGQIIRMETLNSNRNPNNPNPVYEGAPVSDPAIIQNRLDNCQYLEILYLIKHEELMKTFAFTLNLFDKYKYSIKILLFVLKNLVNKQPVPPGPGPVPPGPGVPPTVRLPKPLIPKIWKLLQDQKKVQEVINTMQETLDESKDNYHVGTTITPKLDTGAERPDAKLSSLSRQTAPAGVPTQLDFDVENLRSPITRGLTQPDASANSPSQAKYPIVPADNL